ncbi:hypothetical protein [Corticibacter populi]|uniref:hypothetical protein n=1 Tax=Corticibacter populi TaxID=1550736 RepID=UPI00102B7ED8|nr:hypothetical protein [Corticibacter populi]RZS31045.1 hypothetical protein EV687_3247 [Corticibacter populi]
MSDFRDEFAKRLQGFGKPIDVLNINFSAHTAKMLRTWADQIEAGEISVRSAVLTYEPDTSPDLQKITLVTTTKIG